ncbi:MAG TPA: aldo/keto reductase [Limnochordia bacterium]|nr:aldo/keto reductase [Limnochordia bacterium]
MQYVQLGRTGARVSELCLGCMNFGGATPEAESIQIIHRALDAGINFVDTANVYSRGVSESIVGKALAGRRDQVVLATKVHGRMGDGPNERGNSRLHIMREVENSLRRLQTDHIDLYQIHRPENETTIEETLGALDDLIRQGKVRYIGCSTFAAWQIVESLWTADARRLARFDCEQPPYSLFVRAVENDVLKVTRKYGLGVIPWSPLAGGWLSGKYKAGAALPEGSRGAKRNWDLTTESAQKRLAALPKLEQIAAEAGKSLSQFALGWVLSHPAVTAPIIGPRTMEQLEDNLGAVGWTVTPEMRQAVDQVVPPGTNL